MLDGDVFVVANPSANAAILAVADATSGGINHNGNDAYALLNGSTEIDVIGQIGVDPGSAWGVEPITTVNHTLVRKSTVCEGDPDGSDAFDPAVEWDAFSTDYTDVLGAYTAECGTGPADPKINEFSYDTVSTDVEFIELFGDPNTDYSAYTLLEIEGDSGTTTGYIDEVIAVGTTDGNGLYLASLSANTLENGTVSLLLVKDFTGAYGDDIDADDDGVIDNAPWSELTDAIAVDEGDTGDRAYGSTVLYAYYDGLAFEPGGASRIPDGFDTDAVTDWVRNEFDNDNNPVVGEAYNTPGAFNLAYVETTANPKINEFSYDTVSTDVEFIEVIGDPNTDYSAYTLLEIEGDSGATIGTIDEVIPVGITDGNGLFLASLAATSWRTARSRCCW